MGYYINPADMSKEQFLSLKGIPITMADALAHKFNGKDYPVCLINNGIFTAAGIGYDKSEVEEFAREDERPRQWFLVQATDLEPYYKAKK